MILGQKDLRKIYAATYKELTKSKREYINAEYLHVLIRENSRKLGYYIDKAQTMYIVGFFLRNKVLIPDKSTMNLKVRILEIELKQGEYVKQNMSERKS